MHCCIAWLVLTPALSMHAAPEPIPVVIDPDAVAVEHFVGYGAEWDPQATARAIVAGAGLADRYRKRLRRRHPVWGDGTLAAAARGIGAPVCRVRCDADYRDALALLLVALTDPNPFAIRRDDLYHRDRPAVKERDHGQYTGEGAQD